MRLHFNIRDLLWLVAFAAVLVAWWVDRKDLARKIDALDSALFVSEHLMKSTEFYSTTIPTDYSLIGPALQSPQPTK